MTIMTDDDLALSGVPADLAVDATSASGAVVTTAPTAVAEDSPATGTVGCAHAWGSTFPIGETTVTCTVNDADALNRELVPAPASPTTLKPRRTPSTPVIIHSKLDVVHARDLHRLLDALPLEPWHEQLIGLSALQTMGLLAEALLQVVRPEPS